MTASYERETVRLPSDALAPPSLATTALTIRFCRPFNYLFDSVAFNESLKSIITFLLHA